MFDDENGNFADPQKLPLFQKGKEIYELTHKIADLIEDDNEILAHIKMMMLEDAAMLTVKVIGAEGGDLYDIRMENATIIRKAARDLRTHCTSLEMYGFPAPQYLFLIREALEDYRHLFISWVKSFDPWNYIYDSWGLFNPPGIEEDPDRF